MEASIAGYNATPHDGLNSRTPLEAMEYLVRGKGQMIWWLPEAKRRTMCLMQTAHRCRVRGYLAQGTRPHINLFQVRYTSEVLAASGALLGRELRVYYKVTTCAPCAPFSQTDRSLAYSRRRVRGARSGTTCSCAARS